MGKRDYISIQAIIILWILIFTNTTTKFVLCARDTAAAPTLAEDETPDVKADTTPTPAEDATAGTKTETDAASAPTEDDDATSESKTDVVPDPAFVIPSGDEDTVNDWLEDSLKKIREKNGLEPDLLEAEKNPKIIKVCQKGKGDFKTIKEAVDSIEDKNTNRIIIMINEGIYNEQVTIDADNPYVTLLGSSDGNNPILTFDGTTKKSGLMNSATLAVEGDYFQAKNLDIKNTAKPPADGEFGGNGIALRVSGDAAYFERCTFESFMNTIRDDDGRHLFVNSEITGNEDVIFGDGRSIYLSTYIELTDPQTNGSITANERENTEDTGGGYIFAHGDIKIPKDIKKPNKIFLGRPGAAGARVVVAYFTVDPPELMNAGRWTLGPKPQDEKTLFFAEFQNKDGFEDGVAKFVKELKKDEAEKFLTLDFIQASKWLIRIPESWELEKDGDKV